MVIEKFYILTLKSNMKYLKIEGDKGYYWDGEKDQEIDKIDKDGLLFLLNSVEDDGFELDPYDENKLGNKAHQIIYENIYLKLKQVDRGQFKKEVSELYKKAIKKYSAVIEVDDISAIDNDDKNNEDPESSGEEDINAGSIPF